MQPRFGGDKRAQGVEHDGGRGDVAVDAHIWVKRKLPWVQLPAGHRIFEEAGDWTPDYVHDPGRYRP